jgi:hypothetical protein
MQEVQLVKVTDGKVDKFRQRSGLFVSGDGRRQRGYFRIGKRLRFRSDDLVTPVATPLKACSQKLQSGYVAFRPLQPPTGDTHEIENP